MRQGLLPSLAGGCCLVLSLGSVAAGAEPRGLRDIVYDYAVTSYCGLLTPEVELGFRRELARAALRSGADEEEARALRIAGWVDADREWSNRGLGGFRAWCQSEGVGAAEHFLAITGDLVNPR